MHRGLMNLILKQGHSRVPVYFYQPTNIIRLILVTWWLWQMEKRKGKKERVIPLFYLLMFYAIL
uniref:Uncharacterized protein n=1 Tax=Rhizophora mucronata TaxID=61149 RepID=A0A2P2PPZ5_RHIMU